MSNREQIKGLTIWTVVLIIVAILVVGIVVLSYVLPRKSEQEHTPTPTATEKPNPEPEIILLCTGIIEDITEDTIKIKAEKERNQFLEDRFFEIKVNEQTEILSLGNIPFAIKIGSQIATEPIIEQLEDEEVQTLNLADLETGDYIMVVSGENIKEEDSFVAREIYLLH